MASQIATVAQVKSYLGLTQSTNDAMLQQLLNSSSLMIERYTGLRFEANPAFVSGADTAAPVTLPSIWVHQIGSGLPPARLASDPLAQVALPPTEAIISIPHARQITSVTINDGTTAVAALSTNPAAVGYWLETDSRLYTPLFRRIGIIAATVTPIYNVQVTGKFGIVPAPDDIVDAVLTITARRFREKDAGYSDVVQLQDGAVANYFKQLPASVKAIVDSYCEIGV